MYRFLHHSGCVCTPPGGLNLCACRNKTVYVTLNKSRSNSAQFSYIVSSRFFLNLVRFVKSRRPIFCDCLTHIITRKGVLFPLLATSSPIVTPIDSQNFVDFHRCSNTEQIRHLRSPGQKGAVNDNVFIISWVTLSSKFTCRIF